MEPTLPQNPNALDQPKDIFEEAGSTPVPSAVPSGRVIVPPIRSGPIPNPSPVSDPRVDEAESASVSKAWFSRNKKIVMLLAAIILFGVAAVALYFYRVRGNTPSVVTPSSNSNINTSSPSSSLNLNVSVLNNSILNNNTSPSLSIVDSDRDGLTDSDEKEKYGTNPRQRDTDLDGLSDREEVKVYLTDPKNSDTDKDGYLDGEEVRNLFNPKGTGKLFDLQKEIDRLKNTNSQSNSENFNTNISSENINSSL